jgi:hypothetical protein
MSVRFLENQVSLLIGPVFSNVIDYKVKLLVFLYPYKMRSNVSVLPNNEMPI